MSICEHCFNFVLWTLTSMFNSYYVALLAPALCLGVRQRNIICYNPSYSKSVKNQHRARLIIDN